MISHNHCLIIGAMKAGTTSLFHTLKDYPQINASFIKDTKFFISKDHKGNWHKGIEWYNKQFPQSGLINLEASTHYAKLPYYSGVPERIANTLQNVKLIYLIRNPVERALSHYFHNILIDNEINDINAEFSNIESKYYQYSDYAKQISPYLRYFNESDILIKNIIDSDNDKNDLCEVLSFILDKTNIDVEDKRIQTKNTFQDLLLHNLDVVFFDLNQLTLKNNCSKISLARRIGLKKDVLLKMIFVMQENYNVFSEIIDCYEKNWIDYYEEYI